MKYNLLLRPLKKVTIKMYPDLLFYFLKSPKVRDQVDAPIMIETGLDLDKLYEHWLQE
jgi:hypothetical protein